MQRVRDERTDAMLNGTLIFAGFLGTSDNIVVLWVLGLHRLIEDSPYTLHPEIGLVLVSVVLLTVGLWREIAARRGGKQRPSNLSSAGETDN